MTQAKGRISSDREKRQWLKTVLRWRCSVLPAILPRVIFLGLFGGLVSILSNLNLPVALPVLSSIVPSVVLGLLLVFRTNTAYEGFGKDVNFGAS